MISPCSARNLHAFQDTCAVEHVMGSRALCAQQAGTAESFFFSGEIPAALSLAGNILTVVSPGVPPAEELARFVLDHPEIDEVHASLSAAAAVRTRLGGTLESSWFMTCPSLREPPPDPLVQFHPDPPLEEVFSLLRASHPFYAVHLDWDRWSAELNLWQEKGLTALFGLYLGEHLAGTGRILSRDDQTGTVGAVAVLPADRGRGYGARLSAFLTRRIQAEGRRAVLMSGYDEVAALYRSIGYVEAGRWGELCLNRCR